MRPHILDSSPHLYTCYISDQFCSIPSDEYQRASRPKDTIVRLNGVSKAIVSQPTSEISILCYAYASTRWL